MNNEDTIVYEWKSESGRRYRLLKDTNSGHKIYVWVERNSYWDYCRAAASQTVIIAFSRLAAENAELKNEILLLKTMSITLRANLEKLDRENANLVMRLDALKDGA